MSKPRGGLTAWFGKGPKGDWVDIGAPKKNGKFQVCGRSFCVWWRQNESILNVSLVQQPTE